MEDSFLKDEWTALCEHLRQTAGYLGDGSDERFAEDVERFTSQPTPRYYPELLERTREAAKLARNWREQQQDETQTSS